MKQILKINQAIIKTQALKLSGKKLVLVGGCFDILHLGHVTFLEKAKEKGDVLFVLLESDETIKKIKGENRPVNSQKHRAQLLASLRVVDFVVLLKAMNGDNSYDMLIKQLKPDILATTKGDKGIHHKNRQAKLIGATVAQVTKIIPDKSTTNLIKFYDNLK